MKKRITAFALVLAMILSMTTVAFAAETNDWETPIDVVEVAKVGDVTYSSLDAAFAANAGTVSLINDLTVTDLVVPAGAVLDLNGYTLTATSVDSAAAGAYIIDNTDGDGLLVVNNEYDFNEYNTQLPIMDADKGGFRFFAVTVKSVAVTGKDSAAPKYWFKVQFDSFDEVHTLIDANSEVNIKVLVNCDGTPVEAKADSDFVKTWADTYANNSGIYITAKILESDAYTVTSAAPAVGANGTNIKGAEI